VADARMPRIARRPSICLETLGRRPINPTASATPCPPPPLGDFALSTAREEKERGKEEGRSVGGREEARGQRLPAPTGVAEGRRTAVRGGGRCRRRGKAGSHRPGAVNLPRASWKPALLHKDADTVNPEDRSASAAMDALNVDHHLSGRMPEQ
jgi:hypothetical protein